MSKKIKTNFLLAIIFIVMIFNFFSPVIRFEKGLLNYFFMLIILFIPTYSLVNCFRIKNLFAKIAGVALMGVVSVISLLFAIFIMLHIGFVFSDGYDASSEIIKEQSGEDYKVVAYRLNFGGMTSYSVKVRQEKSLGLGLKLVKDLYIMNHQAEVQLELMNNLLKLEDEQMILKSNVYF